jgi:hypothetical protein
MNPTAFDLVALARNQDHVRRQTVMVINVYRAVGLVMALISAYFFLIPPAGGIAPHSILPLGWLIVGIFLVIVTTLQVPMVGPAPRRLVVTRGSVTFEDIPGRNPLTVVAGASRLRLVFTDYVNANRQLGKGRTREYDYTVRAGRGPETPVPREAYDALLDWCRENQWPLTRKTVSRDVGQVRLTIARRA